MDDELETPREVGRRIKRPVGWLAKKRLTKEGPRFLKIGGSVRYRRRDVDEWLVTCERLSTTMSVKGCLAASSVNEEEFSDAAEENSLIAQRKLLTTGADLVPENDPVLEKSLQQKREAP